MERFRDFDSPARTRSQHRPGWQDIPDRRPATASASTASYFGLATFTTRAEMASTNCRSRDLKGSVFAGVRAAQ
jgi:hypothetical protein